MTPHELSAYLKGLQSAASTAPAQVEAAVRSEAVSGAPGRVSTVVVRTPGGARVLLAGPGARARARQLSRAVPGRARENILSAIRRSR
jgi:hypothetical protein